MTIGGGGASKPEESEYDKELARIRDATWQQYKDRFPEHDRRMIAEARAMDTGARREEARGTAASSVQQQRGMPSPAPGLDPSSGRFMGAVGRDTAARGAGMAAGMSQADTQQTGGYLQRMMGAVKLGQDIENQGTQGLNRLASAKNARSISNAYADNKRDAATGEAVGTAAGYGLQRLASRKPDPSYNDPATRIQPSVINDPGARAYHESGGYRGGGF